MVSAAVDRRARLIAAALLVNMVALALLQKRQGCGQDRPAQTCAHRSRRDWRAFRERRGPQLELMTMAPGGAGTYLVAASVGLALKDRHTGPT